MSKTWYNMTPAKAEGGAAEIRLYDVISREWGQSAEQFAADLKALQGGTVHLRVNSPGGEVQEGWAIYNTIKADPREFVGFVDGAAYSMASVILTACDKVVQPSNAMQLIHRPWAAAIGNAEELRKKADWLDKMETHLLDAYQNRCSQKATRQQIKDMVDAETLIDGREAFAMGLVDECVEPIAAAACKIDLSGMKTDARVLALFAEAKPPEAPNAGNVPVQPEAPVVPPAPVLLDAAVVEARLDAERAAAYEDGFAARQEEINGLNTQLTALRADLTNSQATIDTLKSTVETEKRAREAAVKAHAALVGGVKLTPEADGDQDFEQLQKQYGHAEARRRFPGSYAAWMRQHAPGTKQGK